MVIQPCGYCLLAPLENPVTMVPGGHLNVVSLPPVRPTPNRLWIPDALAVKVTDVKPVMLVTVPGAVGWLTAVRRQGTSEG